MKALWIFLLLLCLTANAELSQYKDRFRLAMEIELQPALVEALVTEFDWDAVERDIANKVIPPNEEILPYLKKGKPLRTLPKDVLARFAVVAAKKGENYPPLSRPPEKGEPLYDLNWELDVGKLEFAFNGSTTDPEAYLSRLKAFSKLVGVEQKIQNPTAKEGPELSFHLHISRKDGTDLTKRVEVLNRLMLMRLVQRDAAKDLFDGTRVSTFADVGTNPTHRGLVRMYEDRSHFELRRHVDDPETELPEILRWLDMPEKAALAEMQAATEALCTETNLTALGELSPRALAIILKSSPRGITDPLLARATEFHIEKGATSAVLHFLNHLAHQHLIMARNIEPVLVQTANLIQSQLRKDARSWVESGTPEIVVAILRFSILHAKPAKDTIQLSDPLIGRAIVPIVLNPQTDEHVRNRFLEYFARNNPVVASAGLLLLKSGRFTEVEASALLDALGPKVLASPEGWETVQHVLRGGNQSLIRAVRREVRYGGDAFTPKQRDEIDAPPAPPEEATPSPHFTLPPSGFRARCWDLLSRLGHWFRRGQ